MTIGKKEILLYDSSYCKSFIGNKLMLPTNLALFASAFEQVDSRNRTRVYLVVKEQQRGSTQISHNDYKLYFFNAYSFKVIVNPMN